MSRVASSPVLIPHQISFTVEGDNLFTKGPKGSLSLKKHLDVNIEVESEKILVQPRNQSKKSLAIAGTFRSLINNMITGVSQGFEKKLELHGVGYKVQSKANSIVLNLGFSHPVNYQLPENVAVEIPSPTEIILKSADKQLLGQVAAEIRSFRLPEPYKGKGLRYSNEQILRKETKKK